jgi:hypothetical protein
LLEEVTKFSNQNVEVEFCGHVFAERDRFPNHLFPLAGVVLSARANLVKMLLENVFFPSSLTLRQNKLEC